MYHLKISSRRRHFLLSGLNGHLSHKKIKTSFYKLMLSISLFESGIFFKIFQSAELLNCLCFTEFLLHWLKLFKYFKQRMFDAIIAHVNL